MPRDLRTSRKTPAPQRLGFCFSAYRRHQRLLLLARLERFSILRSVRLQPDSPSPPEGGHYVLLKRGIGYEGFANSVVLRHIH